LLKAPGKSSARALRPILLVEPDGTLLPDHVEVTHDDDAVPGLAPPLTFDAIPPRPKRHKPSDTLPRTPGTNQRSPKQCLQKQHMIPVNTPPWILFFVPTFVNPLPSKTLETCGSKSTGKPLRPPKPRICFCNPRGWLLRPWVARSLCLPYFSPFATTPSAPCKVASSALWNCELVFELGPSDPRFGRAWDESLCPYGSSYNFPLGYPSGWS
jgi:hypothetical protein